MIVEKKRLFNPYVGEEYEKGINGKKILVVGASFYCNEKQCDHFNKCTKSSYLQVDSSFSMIFLLKCKGSEKFTFLDRNELII
jgi:hypothetical protein